MTVLVARWVSVQQELMERISGFFSLSYPESIMVSRFWWRLALKRVIDLVGSAVLIIVFAPLMLLVAVAVKLTSKGSVLFVQERVGRSGQFFNMLKFRSMVQDAEAATGPVWAWHSSNDPRVTPIGRFLRKSHLDELPQLFNVFTGEMSLVGPRPERSCFVSQLNKEFPEYGDRLYVKPGMTGLAQVYYRYDRSITDVKKKLRFDLLYIRRMCLMLDLRILAATFLVMITGKGVGLR